MALQSLQLRFCLDQFRFSQHLWRSEDTRRRPTGRLLYGNKFALRGSMGKSPRHIVRVARLIKANMTQRVTRVPEIYEHEAAFCHSSPHTIEVQPGKPMPAPSCRTALARNLKRFAFARLSNARGSGVRTSPRLSRMKADPDHAS